MADFSDLNLVAGGDTGAQALTKLRDNQDLLRKWNWGTVAPVTGLTNGYSWLDGADPDRPVGYLRKGVTPGWHKMLLLHLLEQDLDCDLNRLLNARLEAWAAAPSPSAADEGRVGYNTALDRVEALTDAKTLTLAHCIIGETMARLKMEVSAPAGAPALATVHGWKGYQFDALSEVLKLCALVPDGWDGVNDLGLELTFALAAAATASDKVSPQISVRSVVPSSELLTKTASVFTPTDYDVGAFNADASVHRALFTWDNEDVANAGANLIHAGDVLVLDLELDNIGAGYVGDLLLLRADLIVPVDNFDD